MSQRPARAPFVFIAFAFACTLPPSDSPPRETGDTLPPESSSVPSGDDSSGDDSSAPDDSSSAPDDSSVTSGDIEWTLVDSTNGPISHQWAGCDPHDCAPGMPEVCGGVALGVVTSQEQLTARYAESLPGVEYVPEIDFESYAVVWSFLCCCTTHGPWLVVDDVTRVGHTVALSMHVESFELAPAAFGRPWVVVQIPSGDYDDVSHNLH